MIEIPRDAYDKIVAQATEGTPREVCGILGGRYDRDLSRVTSVHPVANAAADPTAEYYIDPEEQLATIETIEETGGAVTAIYHSHPSGPPHPSKTDRARATWPGLSYLIVVLDGIHPYVGSWRWNDDGETFEQEVVRLTPPE